MAGRRRSVEWSEQARLDLLEVVAFLRGTRPAAAARFLDQVDRKLARVARFPQSGRPVPEALGERDQDPFEREIFVMKWRVGYTAAASGRVLVLYVIHGARRFPPIR